VARRSGRFSQVTHPDSARGHVVDQVQRGRTRCSGVWTTITSPSRSEASSATPRPVDGRSGLLVDEGLQPRSTASRPRSCGVEVLLRGHTAHTRDPPLVGSVAVFRHAVVNLTCETPRAAASPARRPPRGAVFRFQGTETPRRARRARPDRTARRSRILIRPAQSRQKTFPTRAVAAAGASAHSAYQRTITVLLLVASAQSRPPRRSDHDLGAPIDRHG
jgi:hypothetical protein